MNRRNFLLTPLALAAVVKGQSARAPAKRPNLVLIVATNWRAQSVPWAGDKDVLAPNLARFSENCLRFSRAYACDPHSERSRESLMKGVFPHILAQTTTSANELEPDLPSLSSVLRDAGYRTGAFNNLQSDDIISFVHQFTPEPFYAEWTFENLSAQLMERIDPSDLQLRGNVPPVAQERTRNSLSNYYARAKTRDHDIGVVLQALNRPEIQDNTIVVFTSDHGEQFGSHGVDGDDYPFEESVCVPLAIRYPRAFSQGSDNNMLVSQADIMPTLLKLCGASVPATVQGRDFSNVILGKPTDVSDTVYIEGDLGQKYEWRALIHGFDKIVIESGATNAGSGPAVNEERVSHLYNLAEDPLELSNLAGASTENLKRDSLLALQKTLARKLGDGVDGSGLKKR